MLKSLSLCLTLSGFVCNLYAQIGIGTSSPEPSSIVDVHSTTKGFLPPRLSVAQRNGINSPAEGLLVFCTDCCDNGSLSFMNGERWIIVNPCLAYDADLDGVPNTLDADDDNDGIPDFIENEIVNEPSFENPIGTVSNEDFENFNVDYGTSVWGFLEGDGQYNGGLFSNNISDPTALTNGLPASHGDNYVIYHSTGQYDGEAIYNTLKNDIISGGRYLFEFDAYKIIFGNGSSFDLDGKIAIYGIKTGQSPSSFGIFNTAGNKGVSKTNIETFPAIFDYLGETAVISSTTEWQHVSIEFTATDTYDRILCVIDRIPGTGSSQSSMIGFDNFNCARDTDGDGLFDHQDTDADNDGCLDSREAGYSVDGFDTKPLGLNGLADELENPAESGVLNTPISASNLANMFNPNVHIACP